MEEKHGFIPKLILSVEREAKGKRARMEEKPGFWVKLPVELLEDIGKRLGSRVDIASFRSVCTTWRSSLLPPSRFPIRVPPPPGADWKSLSGFDAAYHVTQVETYKSVDHGVPKTQYMYLEGRYKPRSFQQPERWYDLFNQRSPYYLSSLYFVSRSYRIRKSYPGLDPNDPSIFHLYPDRKLVKKIVLISSNSNGLVDPYYTSLSDLSLVALLPTGKLALLRLTDSKWDTNFCGSLYVVNISVYQGQLCVIGLTHCQLSYFLMDYHSLRMTPVDSTLLLPLPVEPNHRYSSHRYRHLYNYFD